MLRRVGQTASRFRPIGGDALRVMGGVCQQRLPASSSAGNSAGAGNDAGNGRCAVDSLVQAMERDPAVIQKVLRNMTPESRRRLVVTGGAHEWFGRENVAAEMQRADLENDRHICPKDFDKWFEEALRRKSSDASGSDHVDSAASSAAADSSKRTASDGESTAKSDSNKTAAAAASAAANSIPFGALVLVALEAGLPFVGFGFLDNATMILAGDAIDRSVGFYLNCSVMASAAMGNVVSGCMGMQVHGFVERLVQRLKLPIPPLTEEQRHSQRVFMAGHIGGTIGIATGLTLGLIPLLFLTDEEGKTEMRAFHQLDSDGDGFIDRSELSQALVDLGVANSDDIVDDTMSKYGTDGRLTLDGFRSLCEHLRESKKADSLARQ